MGLMLAEPGFHARAFVEWEEYPRSILIAAQRAGYFAPAPIWDDVTTFDGRPFRGALDTILAGYPCQPFSQAGQRKGADDERHLWPDVARIIREIGPTWVFLENVAGHVTLGLETVLRDLWDMGWTPAAGLFSAAETGAPHERLRVFIVAHRQSADGEWDGRQPTGRSGKSNETLDDTTGPRCDGEGIGPEADIEGGQCLSGDRCAGVGHAARLGRGEGRAEPEFRGGRDTAAASAGRAVANAGGRRSGGSAPRQDQQPGRAEAECAGDPVADPGGAGSQGREWRGSPDKRHRSPAYGSTAERSSPRLFPPGPGDGAAWSAVLAMAPGLAPSLAFGDIARRAQDLVALVDQGQLAQAAAESELRRMVDGLAHRARALRLLGNGVHPLAAANAWRSLAAAHGLGPVDLEAADRGASHDADGVVVRAAE